MRTFSCGNCAQIIMFENSQCLKCGLKLGYAPWKGRMETITQHQDHWVACRRPQDRYRYCANGDLGGCNWLIPAESPDQYCVACRHNRTVPALSDPEASKAWQKIENAKRRLFYSLIRLGLTPAAPGEEDAHPLLFDFLAPEKDQTPVTTGHSDGLITVSLDEADDGKRESMRERMHESYRTLLGHFRHEIGHFYWDKLIKETAAIDTFRSMFGDEREDYTSSLKRHYESGPPTDWSERFISAYASSHPWEDFAETFAHFLHIVDTLEAGRSEGLALRRTDRSTNSVDFDPYKMDSIAPLLDYWLDMAFSLNNISRAMGQPDLYPFVISEVVANKLGYIAELVHSQFRHKKAECSLPPLT